MKYSELMRRQRRNIGIPLVVLALWLAGFDRRFAFLSTTLIITGEMIRIWAAGHLRKEQILTTGGPYRFIRNPLYLGSFLIAIGFCVIANSLWVWLLLTAYFVLCYIPVIGFEEEILMEKFPEDFPPYARDVPALYPTIKMYPFSSTDFSWWQVLKNKEYNAVIGIVCFYAFLFFVKGKLIAG